MITTHDDDGQVGKHRINTDLFGSVFIIIVIGLRSSTQSSACICFITLHAAERHQSRFMSERRQKEKKGEGEVVEELKKRRISLHLFHCSSCSLSQTEIGCTGRARKSYPSLVRSMIMTADDGK